MVISFLKRTHHQVVYVIDTPAYTKGHNARTWTFYLSSAYLKENGGIDPYQYAREDDDVAQSRQAAK